MRMHTATWLIARKDLRIYFRDRASVVLGFLLPIAMATVFGFIAKFAFSGAGGMPRTTLWIADQDGGQYSQRLIHALRAIEMIQVRPRLNEPQIDAAKLRKLVEGGEAHHGLIIEKGFEEAIENLQLPRLTLVRDPDRTMEDQVIRISLVEALVAIVRANDNSDRTVVFKGLLRKAGLSTEAAQRLVGASQKLREAIGESPPASSRPLDGGTDHRVASGASSVEKPEATDLQEAQPTASFMKSLLDLLPIRVEDIESSDRFRTFPFHYAQAVCGVTVMMVMFGLVACSNMLLVERESGTLRRLMAAAIPRASIFWGKFLFCAIVGFVQLVVFFIYGNAIFKIDAFRDPATLLILAATWTVTATSYGMLVAAWARTAKQAETLSTILILVMSGLGGCWFPTQLMDLPWGAELLTRFTLTHWAMTGYQGLFWDQFSWTHPKLLTALAVQWGFSITASCLALILYFRRYVAG